MLQYIMTKGNSMAEDKALWRKALAHYRAWNEAEFADRVRRGR